MPKFVDNEAACQIAEEAFRAGYEAALDHMQPGGPINFSGTVDEAWNEWEPSEESKDLCVDASVVEAGQRVHVSAAGANLAIKALAAYLTAPSLVGDASMGLEIGGKPRERAELYFAVRKVFYVDGYMDTPAAERWVRERLGL